MTTPYEQMRLAVSERFVRQDYERKRALKAVETVGQLLCTKYGFPRNSLDWDTSLDGNCSDPSPRVSIAFAGYRNWYVHLGLTVQGKDSSGSLPTEVTIVASVYPDDHVELYLEDEPHESVRIENVEDANSKGYDRFLDKILAKVRETLDLWVSGRWPFAPFLESRHSKSSTTT